MARNSFRVDKYISLAGQTGAPSDPVNGDIYYDTTLNKFRKYENGAWSDLSGSSTSGGIASVAPGSTITSNYTVVSGDDGRTLNVDTTGGAVTITLPSPSANFKITVKDVSGASATNAITVARNGSENIDGAPSNESISEAYRAVSYVSDGTNWFRIAAFSGVALTLGGRGVFGGGYTGSSSNVIDYITFNSLTNATSFGTLTTLKYAPGSCSSSTRGLFMGGDTSSAGNASGNTAGIDYITIATTGNGTNFGNLATARHQLSGASNSTRGLAFNGTSTGTNYLNTIDYVTIATTGNATSFGSCSVSSSSTAALASQTRAVVAIGNNNGSSSALMEYVTIATTSSTTNFGNLTTARSIAAGCATNTRGVFGGGNTGSVSAVIDYITIATTGNATSFGNLTAARYGPASASNNQKGVWAGGYNGSTNVSTIDYVNIATTGNAASFASLTTARNSLAGCSDSHGGI